LPHILAVFFGIQWHLDSAFDVEAPNALFSNFVLPGNIERNTEFFLKLGIHA